MKFRLICLILLFTGNTTWAQSPAGLDSLLSHLSGNSRHLTKIIAVKKFISQGTISLPALAANFTDTTLSKVFSNCTGRYLTKGEIAIILADRIETMPYFTLTGLQNCLLESCDDNPNFVEYYFYFIRVRGMTKAFQRRYVEWLSSVERKKWIRPETR